MARPRGLCVALDTPDLSVAMMLAQMVAPHAAMLKVGLELYLSAGALAVQALAGQPVFLDLKLHDIPATVAGAVRAVAPLRPALLTAHALGGAAMIAAARAALGDDPGRTRLIAVTVLTSLDAAALAATGIAGGPEAAALALAHLAFDAGADGLVCSGHEVALMRREFGAAPILVVPGMRPDGAAAGDQARVTTPEAAVAAGADVIVVGRPIASAKSPAEAARACAAAFACAG